MSNHKSVSIRNNDFESEVIRLTNLVRTSNHLKALTRSQKLVNIARLKSQDMKNNNKLDHCSPRYGCAPGILRQNDVDNSTWAENLAFGYPTPQAVVNAWINSKVHRQNILNPNLTHIGVGHVTGNWWTQEFTKGEPKSS